MYAYFYPVITRFRIATYKPSIDSDPTGTLSPSELQHFNEQLDDFAQQILKLAGRYRSDQWYEWLLDDCIALGGLGPRIEHPPPAEVVPDLFALAQQCRVLFEAAPPFADIFGQIYQYLSSSGSRKWMGQYFTSSPVATMMAKTQLNIEDVIDKSANDQLLRCADPSGCGSGALMLALAAEIHRHDPELLKSVSITGIDIDLTCCKTMVLNFLGPMVIRNITLGELHVICGDALLGPDDWSTVWYSSTGVQDSSPPDPRDTDGQLLLGI